MEIPLSLEIESINDYSICSFKDKYHPEEVPAHHYIVIPTTFDSYLIICLVSSKWEKRINYYKKANLKCLDSLVILEGSELEFLTQKSIIDCNKAEHIHKKRLENRVVPGTYKVIPENMSEELKRKVVEAIKSSPMIKPYIKQSIKVQQHSANS